MYIILLIIFITGCGHIKNSNEIVKYVRNNYVTDSEVVSFEEDDNGNRIFVMKDKDRNFIFNCSSFMDKISIDGSNFGSVEKTTCNYYEKLTDSLKSQMKIIEDKYFVKFIRNEWDQLISMIEIPITDEKYLSEIDFGNVINAFNELNKLYNFRRLSNINNTEVFICLYNSHKLTEYYFNYSLNGDKVILHNSHDDFYIEKSIPLRIEEDVINFANLLYGEGFEIEDFQYSPKEYSEFDYNCMIYVMRNRKLGLLKELGFNIDSYVNDYQKNTLKSMDNYYDENIKTYWRKIYNFN